VTKYTQDSRDRVFDAVDMLALVEPRSALRRAGVNSFFGLCPFHDERSGSFHVRPEEKHYFCFGCSASGDPFNFVMETEGLDFKAAMEELADRFGVTLETEAEDPAAATRRERRERLYLLLGRASTYYARYLWEAAEAETARAYLLGRGLAEETLREFRVGYAPSAWDRILLASRQAGFSEQELLAVGLAQRRRDDPSRLFDRFRARIMFPSVDARGRVLGFGARAMRDDDPPKYLNTSDGELYHKREVLFGIDLARTAAAKAGRMILVEGYTDVLALHQAELRNAVGIMGTSLTEEQVRELERIVPTVELCLDADRAGEDAMLRASRTAAASRLELRVVPLAPGSDPAELIEREGADALRRQVEASVPFVVFEVERILDRADTGSAEGRDRALGELRPVLDGMPSGVLRDDLMQRIAGELELSQARLASVVGSDGGRGPRRNGVDDGARRPDPPALDRSLRAERAFLALCIAVPQAGEDALTASDPDELLTSALLRRAAGHLRGRTNAPLSELPADDQELARVIADLVELAGRADADGVQRLEHARLLLERDRLDRAIRRARVQGRPDATTLGREREVVLEQLGRAVARLERDV
jgi:DNA primase